MKTFKFAESIEEYVQKRSKSDLILKVSSIINVLNFVAVIGAFLFLKIYISVTGNYNARWYVIYLAPIVSQQH